STTPTKQKPNSTPKPGTLTGQTLGLKKILKFWEPKTKSRNTASISSSPLRMCSRKNIPLLKSQTDPKTPQKTDRNSPSHLTSRSMSRGKNPSNQKRLLQGKKWKYAIRSMI